MQKSTAESQCFQATETPWNAQGSYPGFCESYKNTAVSQCFHATETPWKAKGSYPDSWGLAGSRERPGKTAGVHRVPLRERRFPTGSDRLKHCFFRADQKSASNGAQQVASQGYHNPDDVAAKGTDPCADESRSDAVTYDVAAENHRARHPPSLERLCPRRRRRI